MQFLGRISMSLYLVNMPVMEWIRLSLYGSFNEPLPRQTYAILPSWTTPIQIILNLSLATSLTIFVEEPSKNRLRTLLKKPQIARRLHILGTIFVIFGISVALVGRFYYYQRYVM